MNRILHVFFNQAKNMVFLLGLLFLINGQIAAQNATSVEVYKDDFGTSTNNFYLKTELPVPYDTYNFYDFAYTTSSDGQMANTDNVCILTKNSCYVGHGAVCDWSHPDNDNGGYYLFAVRSGTNPMTIYKKTVSVIKGQAVTFGVYYRDIDGGFNFRMEATGSGLNNNTISSGNNTASGGEKWYPYSLTIVAENDGEVVFSVVDLGRSDNSDGRHKFGIDDITITQKAALITSPASLTTTAQPETPPSLVAQYYNPLQARTLNYRWEKSINGKSSWVMASGAGSSGTVTTSPVATSFTFTPTESTEGYIFYRLVFDDTADFSSIDIYSDIITVEYTQTKYVLKEGFGGDFLSTDWTNPSGASADWWIMPGQQPFIISDYVYGTIDDPNYDNRKEANEVYGQIPIKLDNESTPTYAITKIAGWNLPLTGSYENNVWYWGYGGAGNPGNKGGFDDHTTPNDYSRGYFMYSTNYTSELKTVYKTDIEVTPDMKGKSYTFSAYQVALWGNSGAFDYQFKLEVEDGAGNVTDSAKFNVSDEWAERKLLFTIPGDYTGNNIAIKISAVGNQLWLGLDDISITEYETFVNITSPAAETYFCDGEQVEMNTSYSVANAVEYRWEYSATGADGSWSGISGTTGALSASAGTFDYEASYAVSNGGYYRVSVTQTAGNYSSAVASNVIHLIGKEYIDADKMTITQTGAVSGTNFVGPDENFTLAVSYADGPLNNPVYTWEKNIDGNWQTVSSDATPTIPAIGQSVPASGTVVSSSDYRVYLESDDFCSTSKNVEITITNNRLNEDFKTGANGFIATDDIKNTYTIPGLSYIESSNIERDGFVFTKTPAQYWAATPEVYDRTGNGGYFLQIYKGGNDVGYDANTNPIAFYETTIDGICTNSEYSFTAWTSNLRPNADNYELKFKVVFLDASGTEISPAASYLTDAVNTSDWTQYGFNLIVPAGATRAVFSIESTGDLWGSNLLTMFTLDDVEIKLITPVRITSHTTSSIGVPEGSTTTLEGNYLAQYDCGTMVSPLTYQWQKSTNGNDWTDITGATLTTYTTDLITTAIYYRLTVSDSNNRTLASDNVQVVPFSLSAKIYYVCPDNMTDGEIRHIPSLIRLSMPEVPGVGYNWYETETEGTPMLNLDNYNDDRTAMVSDGNMATISIQNVRNAQGIFNERTYWVEPYDISSGKTLISERIPVDLKQGFVCASLDAAVSPSIYKRLYQEDFGFGTDNISTVPVQGMEYTQRTTANEGIDAGTYKVVKVNDSGDGWLSGITDHIYNVPDAEHGYMVQVNAASELSQFYTHTLTGLDYCTDIQLVFSSWLLSPLNWYGTDKACLIFILKNPDTGEVLSEFITGNLIDNDQGRWRQFAFKFPVPEGINSVELIVKNNTAGDVGGNDFILDDIEVYLHIPPVQILPAVSGNVCSENYAINLEGSYEDDGTLGKDLSYRWEYRINDNYSWAAIPNSEGNVATGSVTREASQYVINNFTNANTGEYRLVIGQQGVFQQSPINYDCIAISETRTLTYAPGTPPTPELRGLTSACLNDGAITIANIDNTENIAAYEKYVWTVDGNVVSGDGDAATIALTEPGYHTVALIAYNDDNCFANVAHEYLVYPDTTTWTAEGTLNNWNDRYNWSNGIPGECTSVIIPNKSIAVESTTLLAHYPLLIQAAVETLNQPYNTDDTNYAINQKNLNNLRNGINELRSSCDTITFKMGASVARTDYLKYNFAKVELNILPNQWNMVSSPLGSMYSGDYFVEGNVKRLNPAVYMMKYNATNPETQETPVKQSGDFSNPFNTLNQELYPGLGYAVWVDDGKEIGDPSSSLQSLSFPKDSTKYAMWNYHGNFQGHTSIPERNYLGRFAYEKHVDPNGLPNKGTTTGFETVLKEDNSTYTTTLVGNPFMSHLSFSDFVAANDGISGGYYILSSNGTYDANMPILGDVNEIAPMQSFIVEKSGTMTSLNFTFDMSVTSEDGVTFRSAKSKNMSESAILQMDVLRDGVTHSNIRIKYNSTESNEYNNKKDMWTLFSEDNTPAVLYALLNGKAASIRTIGDLSQPIELGIFTDTKGILTLHMTGLESLDTFYEIYLEDRLTGTRQDLRKNAEYAFDNQTGNVTGRLFLIVKSIDNSEEPENPDDIITGDKDILSDTGIRVFANNRQIVVTSSTNDPIESVKIYSLNGKLLYTQQAIGKSFFTTDTLYQSQMVVVAVTTGLHQEMEKLIIE